jgi:GT2 family glycosyltransferase
MADLSVIIVNYNSGWYCSNLIDSLLDQTFTTSKGDAGTLEIIVVDNASPQDQRSFLDPLRDKGVKVIYGEENTGYAGGNNLGMRHVTADWVMITNPDVVFMPGSLQPMLEVLYAGPKVGAVGPRGWLDPAFHFLLPPVERLTLRGHLYETTGRIFKSIGRRYSMARARYALGFWSGKGLWDAEVISGFCFMMPTALARELGPYDPRFPFYYEDNDLSFRLARRGYRQLIVKDTRVIHFYNKSAGPVFDEVIEKYYRSKSYFFQKHYGWLRHGLYKASTEYLKKRIDTMNGSFFERVIDLGERTTPPELGLSDQAAVVEITLDPAFVLAAGHLHPGGPYRMPQDTWDVLDATTWYLRVLDGRCKRSLKTYRWEKTTPGALPPAYVELKGRAR